MKSRILIVSFIISFWSISSPQALGQELKGRELKEVTVMGYRVNRGNNSFTYTPKDIGKILTLTGEPDVMRMLQILPGISQGMEGGMGFYVRGAGNGNSRVELEGVPISAPTHLLGIFSTFPSDIVDRSTFQMGGFDASSGDYLSSLLKIETLTPETSHHHSSLSISPLMLGGSVEGYMVKDRLSFQVAGRTSLLGTEYKLLNRMLSEDNRISGGISPQIQDLYGNIYWRISPCHGMKVMLYGSHDYFDYNSEEAELSQSAAAFQLGWDNRVTQVKWIYDSSNNFKIQTSAYYTSFKNNRKSETIDIDYNRQGVLLGSEEREYTLRSQLTTILRSVLVNVGVDYRYQMCSPIKQNILIDAVREASNQTLYHTSIVSLFGEGVVQSEKYKLKGGLRYNLFLDDIHQAHYDVDIHLLGSTFLTHQIGLEATFDRLTQFRHTLEGLPVGWALDLRIPASNAFPPEVSNQFYLGAFGGNSDIYASVGGYFKFLNNLTSYNSFLNQFSTSNISWEEDLLSGKGESYGLELWVEKRNSRWTGSLAYTLSGTTRRFEGINGGNPYPFKFDRPHNINIQSQYVTFQSNSREQHANVALYLSSGNNLTIPLQSYEGIELPYWSTRGRGGIYVPPMQEYHATVRTQMSSVNGYRLSPYIRVDAGYTFLWQRGNRKNELTLSVFNLLNRKNPYLIFYEKGLWKQLSILPIVPSIRWKMQL